MKRTAVIALLGVLAGLVSTATGEEPARQLRIATQPAPLFAPIFVAKQKHWIEDEAAKQGITVKWSSFLAGPPENESFIAGQQDIGVIGDTPAIVARSAGLKTRIIGIAAFGPKTLALVAQQDSSIKTVADLKGKKVAVTKGSYAHHLLYILLKNAGLTVNDIKLIHLAPADLVASFQHKDVDAAVTWEPFLSKVEEAGGRLIADGTGIKKGELVIFAVDDFAKKNPELVKTLLQIYQRGAEFIKANPDEAAKLIASDVKLEPDQVRAVLKNLDFSSAIRKEDVEELKKTEEFLRENNLLTEKVDIDAFIDTTYIKAAGLQN